MVIGLLQLLVAAWLALMSAFLLFAVRQIAFLSRRVNTDDAGATSLKKGDNAPALELSAYRSASVFIPPPNRAAILLFFSFSCDSCRLLLEQIGELPSEFEESLVLMVLDSRFEVYFDRDLRRLGLDRFQLVEAHQMSNLYQIRRHPLALSVSKEGIVRDIVVVRTIQQLVQLLTSDVAGKPQVA